ncbi:hypothetical protein J6590_024565 [Homalodisca vitripennis]|nr:hypothetical protein J6590_024565 [Homalodisca vitripennis]
MFLLRRICVVAKLVDLLADVECAGMMTKHVIERAPLYVLAEDDLCYVAELAGLPADNWRVGLPADVERGGMTTKQLVERAPLCVLA